jgi:hypothetical protein
MGHFGVEVGLEKVDMNMKFCGLELRVILNEGYLDITLGRS